MANGTILITASLLAIMGVAILRHSWGRPLRSRGLNACGWLVLAAAAIAAWSQAGAWGASIVSLWAMGTAFVLLALAAWRSPPARRAPSNRRAGMLPERGGAARLGGRIVTFLLVTGAGMLAAIALAITSRWLMLVAGASEANANVIALFAAPLGWTVLVVMMLMTDSRRRQLAILGGSLVSAIPAIVSGAVA